MIQDYHFNESGERETPPEQDAEGFILRFAARYNLSQESSMAAIAEVQEEFMPEMGGVESLRRKFWDFRSLIERGWLQLQAYEKRHGDRVMAERCLWLLLGFPTVAGAGDLASLVRLLGREKATVNKCLQFFQKQIPELPILPGQRKEEHRENMSRAQKKIWHGNREKK
jgi:hypothetical protein